MVTYHKNTSLEMGISYYIYIRKVLKVHWFEKKLHFIVAPSFHKLVKLKRKLSRAILATFW